MVKISALVVGFNEATKLDQCLKSILFCQQIIYIDLFSVDNSIEIAKKYTSEIYFSERTPSGELTQKKFINKPENEWILIIDPDEVVGVGLKNQILSFFNKEINANIGAIAVPWLFYYKGKRLTGTIWGYNNYKTILFKKTATAFTNQVHSARKIKSNYKIYHFNNLANKNVLHHYWMDSKQQWFEKHKRYLNYEAESRILGQRTTSLFKLILAPFYYFFQSFILKRGFKTRHGLFLSFYWAWYQTMATYLHLKLKRENGNKN